MTSTAANGITIEYETFGNRQDPPLLLVMGLGAQMTAWRQDFVDALVERGFWVIRYDHRDVGLSTWFDEAGPGDVMAAMTGTAKAPYLLSDMAADAAGLLDALDVTSAHVVGVSMGGMIVQTLVIEHPSRVRSLTSIMSTTGDQAVGAPQPEAMEALMVPPAEDRDGVIKQSLAAWSIIGSPGFPTDEDQLREEIGAAYDRAYHPDGAGRQMVAIMASGDRTTALRQVDRPTLVIHGEADKLVDPSGGRATAAAIPGAALWTIPGMGHDLPPQLHGEVADRIAAHAHPHD